jgi:hypothetical protein
LILQEALDRLSSFRFKKVRRFITRNFTPYDLKPEK